jgi:organic hydroperoxide reductase OsmC/OhrA
MTTKLDKVLYTAKAHTTGGREGRSVTDDGLLDVTLAPPKEMGGKGGATNPEQLFAAGYSACFIGAIKFVAGPEENRGAAPAIDASVSIGPIPGRLRPGGGTGDQPAGHGTRRGAGTGGCGAPGVPVLECDAR